MHDMYFIQQVSIRVGGEDVVSGSVANLRSVWEATSFQLERLQCNPACVKQEASGKMENAVNI